MRCLPLLLLLACSEEVLPLGSTPAQCTAALEVSHTVFEDQTVTDPPATASIDGEVAVVLNQQSLEVVRFSSDARDPDPIASHTAELAKVLRLEGGSNDYHLLTRLYGSTDVWLAHQRVLDAASATWRAGEDVEILDAVVSNESVLVAVKTSLTTFRIHAAEDVTAVRGASFAPGGDVASARIFPRARLVASWSTFSSGAEAMLHPFDPITGDPIGPAQTGFCGSFIRRPTPIDVDSGFAVVDCEEGSKLVRLADGRELQLTNEEPLSSSRIASDAAGRLGIATWSSEDIAPIFHVVDPASMTKIGDPILLEAPDEWGTPTGLAATADPQHPGRFAVLYAYVFGHGWGRMRFARINTCAE